jgi:hypothetical protein
VTSTIDRYTKFITEQVKSEKASGFRPHSLEEVSIHDIILSENKTDLPFDTKLLLLKSHRAIGHLLDNNTRVETRDGYSEKLYDNSNYLKSLHHAIGNSLVRLNSNTPDMRTSHPKGKMGGLVKWERPKHQKALLWMARDVLNSVNAQHGNPFNYGNPVPSHKMNDGEFDEHIRRLGDVVGTKPWPEEGMKDTIDKVARRS